MVPHRDRLDSADPRSAPILDAHDQACARGEAGYLDPFSGLFVMTAAFHRDRGTCCDSGCRHCPFLEAVDETD